MLNLCLMISYTMVALWLHYGCIAWLSGSQDQKRIPDIQLWQEQHHMVGDRHSQPQESVGFHTFSSDFRQIQRRMERNALNTAA